MIELKKLSTSTSSAHTAPQLGSTQRVWYHDVSKCISNHWKSRFWAVPFTIAQRSMWSMPSFSCHYRSSSRDVARSRYTCLVPILLKPCSSKDRSMMNLCSSILHPKYQIALPQRTPPPVAALSHSAYHTYNKQIQIHILDLEPVAELCTLERCKSIIRRPYFIESELELAFIEFWNDWNYKLEEKMKEKREGHWLNNSFGDKSVG